MEPRNSWEDMKDSEFEWRNGRLTVHPVPTLMEISSFKVALAIWESRVSHSVPDFRMRGGLFWIGPKNYVDDEYLKQSKKILQKLNTPSSIEKIITGHLVGIDRKILIFIQFLDFEVFRKIDGKKWFVKRIDPEWLSWRSNGDLDYHTTVSSMLSTAELSKKQKFAIICAFCRVDEIMSCSPESIPSSLVKSITLRKNPVLYYWICYLRNELDKIPLERAASLDAAMADQCYSNDFAFEYFWDRLNSEDKVNEAAKQIGYSIGESSAILIRRFLPKMTRDQQYQLFCKIPIRIVKLFWIWLRKPQCAISIWLWIRDQCADEFIDLVQRMLHTDIIICEEEMRLFMKLWNESPVELKQRATLLPVGSLTKAYLRHKNFAPSSVEFLYEFLSLSSANTRIRVMRRISPELSKKFTRCIRMIDVIKLCYPDDEERANFLKKIRYSKRTQKYSLRLLNDEKFDDLTLMLKIISPGVDTNREFVKELLDCGDESVEPEQRNRREISIEKSKFVLDHDKWTKLSKFIDDTCGSEDDPTWVTNLKKQFVSLFASADGFYWRIENLTKLTEVIDHVFDLEEARGFRKTLLDIFKTEIISETKFWKCYDEKYFVEFVSWCLDGAQKMEEFRASLPRDSISDSMFESACHAFRTSKLAEFLEGLNKCLKAFWSEDEAKRYKIRKMHEFNNEIILNALFQPNMKKNLKLVLRLVFDDEVEEMEKWRLTKQPSDSKKRKRPDYDDESDDAKRPCRRNHDSDDSSSNEDEETDDDSYDDSDRSRSSISGDDTDDTDDTDDDGSDEITSSSGSSDDDARDERYRNDLDYDSNEERDDDFDYLSYEERDDDFDYVSYEERDDDDYEYDDYYNM